MVFGSRSDSTRKGHGCDCPHVEQGNISRVKPVGEGVLEYKIDFGPGYRLYFGRDGDVLVILLTGGTKKRQQRDIERAAAFWRDYRRTRRATQSRAGEQ
jgi:putative addiction module killer protein